MIMNILGSYAWICQSVTLNPCVSHYMLCCALWRCLLQQDYKCAWCHLVPDSYFHRSGVGPGQIIGDHVNTATVHAISLTILRIFSIRFNCRVWPKISTEYHTLASFSWYLVLPGFLPCWPFHTRTRVLPHMVSFLKETVYFTPYLKSK